MSDNETLAALAVQVAALAGIVTKQGERIGQLERAMDDVSAQLGSDDVAPELDLAGRPVMIR